MAFERPTLKELIERIGNDAKSRLTTAQLRQSNSAVFSRVLAGASHELHGHIEWIAKQLFVDTCEAEYLDRWASMYGVARKAASKASGEVTFSFSGDEVTVPEGAQLQNADGTLYKTTADSASGKAEVEAVVAGADGNMDAGDELTLVSPVAGVYSTATCGQISGGTDEEGDESLRSRLLTRMQDQPHGGSKSDYVAWALEVAGVTRAWCYPQENGVGTVTVRFVCDGQTPITPTETQVEAVAEHLDEERPVTAQVTVEAPTLVTVPVTIESLTPDTSAVRAAVEEELSELFAREAEPGGLIYLSHIRAAISAAMGEEDHTLISPTVNVTAKTGELLTLGEITWQ